MCSSASFPAGIVKRACSAFCLLRPAINLFNFIHPLGRSMHSIRYSNKSKQFAVARGILEIPLDIQARAVQTHGHFKSWQHLFMLCSKSHLNVRQLAATSASRCYRRLEVYISSHATAVSRFTSIYMMTSTACLHDDVYSLLPCLKGRVLVSRQVRYYTNTWFSKVASKSKQPGVYVNP